MIESGRKKPRRLDEAGEVTFSSYWNFKDSVLGSGTGSWGPFSIIKRYDYIILDPSLSSKKRRECQDIFSRKWKVSLFERDSSNWNHAGMQS